MLEVSIGAGTCCGCDEEGRIVAWKKRSAEGKLRQLKPGMVGLCSGCLVKMAVRARFSLLAVAGGQFDGRSLGAELRRIRKEKGLTLETVSGEAGFSGRAFLSQVEREERLPSVPALAGILRALGVSVRRVSEFYARAGRLTPGGQKALSLFPELGAFLDRELEPEIRRLVPARDVIDSAEGYLDLPKGREPS